MDDSLWESDRIQIDKDIDRTFNEHKYFGVDCKGRETLRDLLYVLTLKYQHILGYVQGMNFLVAGFLYHSWPEVALVLATSLIENYQLCDVYWGNLEGLHDHNLVVDKIISEQKSRLYQHFIKCGVKCEMFTTSWILDLFAHLIPLD